MRNLTNYNPEYIDLLINKLSVMTMEGDIKWSSIDVLDIKMEILDKKDLVRGLSFVEEELKYKIKEDIRFLALKGYQEERILKHIARKESRLREVVRRKKFAAKTKRRLEKRLDSLKPEFSRGWYIDFKEEGNTYSHFSRFFIRKVKLDDSVTYYAGITSGVSEDSRPFTEFTSDDYPILLTLGILLKNKERVIKDSSEIYLLKL